MWCIQNNLSNSLNSTEFCRAPRARQSLRCLATCYWSICNMSALTVEHPHLRMFLKRYALQFMGSDHDTNRIVMLYLYNIELKSSCQYLFSLIANFENVKFFCNIFSKKFLTLFTCYSLFIMT